MARTIPLLILTVATSFAAVPITFTAGNPAKADDVNKNFASLDSAIQKKADASAVTAIQTTVSGLQTGKADASQLATKADISIKDSLKARVDTGSFSAFKTKEAADVASLNTSISNLPTTASLIGIRDTLRTKIDSNWVKNAITKSQPTGTLLASNNLKDLADAVAARKSLGLGTLATKNTLSAADVGAISSTSATGDTLKGALTVTSMVSAGGFRTGGNVSAASANLATLSLGLGNLSGILSATGSSVGVVAPGQEPWAISGSFQGDFNNPPSQPGIYNISGTTTNYFGGSINSGTGSLIQAFGVNGNWKNQLVLDGESGLLSFRTSVDLGANGGYTNWRNWETVASREWVKGLGYTMNNQFLPLAGGTVTGDLHVAGDLTARPNIPVADYVFEQDYKLTTLSEVEAYTKEHKHLPEVPSATEIGKNGLDLAQMNLVLLKKVEELTLHAIAQQKTMEAQAKADSELRGEVAELKAIVDDLKAR